MQALFFNPLIPGQDGKQAKGSGVPPYIGQLQSDAVMNRVISKLKLDRQGLNSRTLSEVIRIEAIKDTNLIELRVIHADPRLASTIADTMAGEFLTFLSEKNEEQMAKSVDFLKKQLAINDEELQKAVLHLNNLRHPVKVQD